MGRRMFFEGFALQTIDCGEVALRVRHGGDGPPVVLLHGHPRTHATWHRVAALLADRHTVVCPDLRGYGGSSAPPDAPDHAQASKRAMARDVVALMDALGHERFAVAGHDRGGSPPSAPPWIIPERVVALTTVGRAVPIAEALARIDLASPASGGTGSSSGRPRKPAEKVIAAIGPDDWYRINGPEVMGAEAHADVWAALRDPAVVHGMCEDYRAGADDRRRARSGRPRRRPARALPGAGAVGHPRRPGPLRRRPARPVAGWADDLRGAGIDSGHHVAEEAPEATAAALAGFWAEVGWTAP